VSENRILRILFELKGKEVTGGGENYIMKSFIICSLLRNLIEQFSRLIKSRRMRWNIQHHGVHDTCIYYLIGKTEGKRPPLKTGHRWEDNIKMNVK
jgi:hypothetical protein